LKRAYKSLVLAGAALLMLLGGVSPATAATPADRPSPSVTITMAPQPDQASTSTTIGPNIIGGVDATRVYEAMGSVQFLHKGDPNWHTCAAVLNSHWTALTNAHCVTNYPDGSAAEPANQYHVRFGSNNRLDGGIVVGVAQILPHADWNWGADPTTPISDIAVLRLDAYVPLQPFPIPDRPQGRSVREIGWGLTTPAGTTLPLMLQQLDTRLLWPQLCAAAGITIGELCLASPHGDSGACYGDSGGPGLQRDHLHVWVLIGGASRETTPTCGTGPNVYTDMTVRHEAL
jgi:hypothetical protein